MCFGFFAFLSFDLLGVGHCSLGYVCVIRGFCSPQISISVAAFLPLTSKIEISSIPTPYIQDCVCGFSSGNSFVDDCEGWRPRRSSCVTPFFFNPNLKYLASNLKWNMHQPLNRDERKWEKK